MTIGPVRLSSRNLFHLAEDINGRAKAIRIIHVEAALALTRILSSSGSSPFPLR